MSNFKEEKRFKDGTKWKIYMLSKFNDPKLREAKERYYKLCIKNGIKP